MQTLATLLVPLIVLAGAITDVAAQSESSGRAPLESRKPNAPDQRPAFPGQTRACAITSTTAFDVVVVAKGLEKPWAVEPLPDGDFLITEKGGRMRIVSAAGEVGQPISGVPEVDARGQGGLLDVALSPGLIPIARSSGATPNPGREAMEPLLPAPCSRRTVAPSSRCAFSSG